VTAARGLAAMAALTGVLWLVAASADALAAPTLSAAASGSTGVGQPITDTATLGGGVAPTGTITFDRFAPDDPACTGAPVQSTVAVSGDGKYTSPAFTADAVGVYHFRVSYSGDARNAPVPFPTGLCALDVGQTVVAGPATPAISTSASASVPVGGQVTDSASVSGGYMPTGNVAFTLYGPGDATCGAAPVFSSSVAVGAPAVSAAFLPTAPGTYRWIAAYGGDARNVGAAGTCGEVGEAVTVTAATPTVPAPTAIVTGAQDTSFGLPLALTGALGRCDPQAMANRLDRSIVAALTGAPGSAFRATCGGSVRIILRSLEIRPGNSGVPRGSGYTTIGDTLTHESKSGQIAFSLNSQAAGLRQYARSAATTLSVFAIVRVRPIAGAPTAEAINIFSLR
jgi:hypothetical protein